MQMSGAVSYTHLDVYKRQVHVSRLRRKIDDGFATPLVHTIRGAGYMLGAAS